MTKVHFVKKWLLKPFFSKSDIIASSKKTGGQVDNFLLFENLFIDYYVSVGISGLSNFVLKLARYLSFFND